jgi:serine/threonine protein kinase
MITKTPMFQGNGEIDQLGKIFKIVGSPTEDAWPGYRNLPSSKQINFKHFPSRLAENFSYLSPAGLDLLTRLLNLDPKSRISAKDALEHEFFKY